MRGNKPVNLEDMQFVLKGHSNASALLLQMQNQGLEPRVRGVGADGQGGGGKENAGGKECGDGKRKRKRGGPLSVIAAYREKIFKNV